MTDTKIGNETQDDWECFRDHSYFDMWCVRPKGIRDFGQGFHLMNGEEAKALCDALNASQGTGLRSEIDYWQDQAAEWKERHRGLGEAALSHTKELAAENALKDAVILRLRRVLQEIFEIDEPISGPIARDALERED